MLKAGDYIQCADAEKMVQISRELDAMGIMSWMPVPGHGKGGKMKGYKGIDESMRCRGMRLKIQKRW